MDKLNRILALPENDRTAAAIDVLGLKGLEDWKIFVLGQEYVVRTHAPEILAHIISLCRLTYRSGFEAVDGFATDAGWGCMMRTGQMAVANCLIKLLLGSDWKLATTTDLTAYRQLLRFFADSPRSPLSIQNISLTGKQLDINVGQWFGPTTISHVLRRIINTMDDIPLSVYVARDSTISIPDLEETSGYWSKKVLILVPLRLGLNSIEPVLAHQATSTLAWPNSCGILGGKPRASYWFVGVQGDYVLYVDPHVTQPTVDMSVAEFPLESYHSHQLLRMKAQDLDPSLALAFFCNDSQDLESLKSLNSQRATPLFTFSDTKVIDTLEDTVLSSTTDTAECGEEWDVV
eukprot:c12676_g1_i1.p1 GENE.c12676_g1_i1~~c12676_g1_i1.p1  ORF type:complete len:347 (-),score=100.30 c12676_g1_i1:79-1119(-)